MSEERGTSMLIGAVAKLAGVSIQTVRYYERIGLLKPATRKVSRYRVYDVESVIIIRFIKQAQELGFTLHHIEELIGLKADTKAKCEAVQRKALKHFTEIENRIKKLDRIRNKLSEMINNCRLSKIQSDCPLLICLDENRREA